jgi:hydrogenase maturation protease
MGIGKEIDQLNSFLNAFLEADFTQYLKDIDFIKSRVFLREVSRMGNQLLVLFIGNSLFKDDRIGLIVGERLKPVLEREGFHAEILDKSGLSLIDYIEGRELVIIVDSIITSEHQVGEVINVDLNKLESYSIWSPHYMGVPETLKVMEELGIPMPEKLYVIGIEVADVYTISEEISKELEEKLGEILSKVYEMIKSKLHG